MTAGLSWSPELRQPPQTWTSCSTGGRRGGAAGSWSSARPQFSVSGSQVPPVDEISHKLYDSAVLCSFSFSLKLVIAENPGHPGEVIRSYGSTTGDAQMWEHLFRWRQKSSSDLHHQMLKGPTLLSRQQVLTMNWDHRCLRQRLTMNKRLRADIS